MGIINVLDFKVANLIAAGEVVDRPASVIKELMENSIDAGANSISVEIQNGGITLMRVIDNGKGMSRDDVPVAIKRHATSKIKEENDLDGIMTLGFRGEALAAIASVCKMKIITKTASAEMGTMLISEAGNAVEISEIGCQDGTTVICEELFANVPARRKFMKTNTAETAATTAVVEKIALSRPDISVKYTTDNVVKFSTQGDGKLMNSIYAVLGRDFAKKLINVKSVTEGIEVTGYIGSPDYVRGNRNYQNFFINDRYVKSKTAMAALEQAFNSFIPSDKFPACILDIKIHPAYVDVNVHPAKLEVKFSDEKAVFNAVYCAVRNALMNNIKRPEIKLEGEVRTKTGEDVKILEAFTPIDDGYNNRADMSAVIKESKEITNIIDIPFEELVSKFEPAINETNNETKSKAETAIISESEVMSEPVKEAESAEEALTDETPAPMLVPLPTYKLIGETFYSYVIVELADRVLMIDKHAAHERIIFENMKNNLHNENVVSQILLIPIDIYLNPQELAALTEYDNEIKSIGFDYEIFENYIKVRQIPNEIEQNAVEDVIVALAGNIADNTGTVNLSKEMIYEKALYQASCKAAVKAGHNDSREHIIWICEKVLTMPDIKYCPHGRPVAFELTKHDIEKQFKRI